MTNEIEAWLAGRLPAEWFEGTPSVTVDRDEVLVVGTVPAPDRPTPEAGTNTGISADADAGTDEAHLRAAAVAGRLSRFREETRGERMRIAAEAEHRFGRKLAWGASCEGTRQLFTTLSVPVMTRLRQPERVILDTLVDAGVARSRSHALAWCVRLVGEHAEDWLEGLRGALTEVRRLRDEGPDGR